MTRDEKMNIQRRISRRRNWGQSDIFALSFKILLAAAYLAGALFVYNRQDAIRAYGESIPLMSPVFLAVMQNAVPIYLIAGEIALTVLLVYPFGKRAAQDQLQSIGLVNHTGLAPELLRKRRDKAHPNVTIWVFRDQGIPLDTWELKRTAIEAALDITIVKMTYAPQSKSRILLHAVPARTDLPAVLPWKDKYLSSDSFVLALGESLLGPVKVNLVKIPHVLLGGSTGSGKSVLLKLLLMQAVKKGAMVCIADFKGGVDFPPVWHEKCQMCFNEAELPAMLDMLITVIESRKALFRNAGCPNLDEYIKATGDHQSRYIFACDEVAEVLDKTGRSKEDKELLGQIENRLATIARQGRAFGIHLILATQRPDATVIPGQIRNNMDFRVCGRADSILSQIILDNTSAADLIPKDTSGRFILHNGTIFQAYWTDDAIF